MDYSWNSSYIYAFDNASGWGERYFFSYFTQMDESPSKRSGEVTILMSIFVLAIILNGSLLACVYKYPDMRSVTNCFIANMAMADLLMISTAPAVAMARLVPTWNLGLFTCKVLPYMQFVAGVVILWTMTLISLDRHNCIVIPPYRSRLSPRQTIYFSLLLWIFCAFLFIPVCLWFRVISLTESNIEVCTLVFPKSNFQFSLYYITPIVFFGCILPMILLMYFYHQIFYKLLSTRNTWASSCVMVSSSETGTNQGRRQSELSVSDIFVPWPRRMSTANASCPNGRQGSLSHHEEVRVSKHVRVVRVLLLHVILVLVFWVPITIVMVLIYLDGSRDIDDTNFFLRSNHFIYALVIAYTNTLVNPLIYGLLNDNFRNSMMKLFWLDRKPPERDLTVISISKNQTRSSRKQSFEVSEN